MYSLERIHEKEIFYGKICIFESYICKNKKMMENHTFILSNISKNSILSLIDLK